MFLLLCPYIKYFDSEIEAVGKLKPAEELIGLNKVRK